MHRKRFAFDENVAKKSATQELAAASGVPPAFRKQLEQFSIFTGNTRTIGLPCAEEEEEEEKEEIY